MQINNVMSQTYFLPAKKLRLKQRDDGSLMLNLDGQAVELDQPKRALPLSDPDRFIVLCDTDGNELGMVRDVAELEPASRELLRAALERAYVIERITRILKVERDTLTGQTRWRVEIALKSEQEITPPDQWPQANGHQDGGDRSQGDGSLDKADASIVNKIRLFRNKDREKESEKDADIPAIVAEEREFLINGQEDVQTARYPHIYIVDTERNRYEIPNCEELDIESRREAERYF